MLQKLAVHSLTTNTTIVSKHLKGGSAKWSSKADEISRNVPPQINGATQRAPDWEDPEFWFANIRGKSAAGLLGALSPKDKKSLAKSPPTKGGKSQS